MEANRGGEESLRRATSAVFQDEEKDQDRL